MFQLLHCCISDADSTDLLCPGIKLVKELLRDVGCIPRHSNHGANPYKTLFTLDKWHGFQCKQHSYTYILTF